MNSISSKNNPPLKPLLKWTGGKRSEIPFLKSAYPKNIKRVVEPFSGGAAVSFDLNPEKIIINDLNKGLLEFYRSIKSESARGPVLDAIGVLDEVRKRITKSCNALSPEEIEKMYFTGSSSWVEKNTVCWIEGMPGELAPAISKDLRDQLNSKVIRRIPELEKKRGEIFSVQQRREHIETGLQAGVYTCMRRLYNHQISGVTPAWSVAAWWFVRSLCYSGMFRYGKNGNFNVPYGGIGYNSRDLTKAVNQLKSADVLEFLQKTTIFELDFEELFKVNNYFEAGDFIFVDPPYDSAFSKYNSEEDFSHEDQRRLAETLKKTKAPWMLVIKNTPFILSLYQDEGLYRGVFGKKYQVNFRNRHDRGVEHLVVTNYPIEFADPGSVGIYPEVDLY